MDLPKADVYLLSKLLHGLKDEEIEIVLKKVYTSLNTGGVILLAEKLLNETKDGPLAANLLDLQMCGRRHQSGREYTELLRSHGFTQVHLAVSQVPSEYDVIMARKI